MIMAQMSWENIAKFTHLIIIFDEIFLKFFSIFDFNLEWIECADMKMNETAKVDFIFVFP